MAYMNELQEHLERFRLKYFSINVTIFDNSLVYKTEFGRAKSDADEANEIIRILKLPLVAETNSTNGIFTDTFVIKSAK